MCARAYLRVCALMQLHKEGAKNQLKFALLSLNRKIDGEWDISASCSSMRTVVVTPFMAGCEGRPGWWSRIGVVFLLTNTQRRAVYTRARKHAHTQSRKHKKSCPSATLEVTGAVYAGPSTHLSLTSSIPERHLSFLGGQGANKRFCSAVFSKQVGGKIYRYTI